MTKKISLNGMAIITGGGSIIPIDIRTRRPPAQAGWGRQPEGGEIFWAWEVVR
jgi:hypothetical protein